MFEGGTKSCVFRCPKKNMLRTLGVVLLGLALVGCAGTLAWLGDWTREANSDFFKTELVNDQDEDGIPDDQDNCPSVPNKGQEDGDGDGVGDVCDNCPDTPNGPAQAKLPGVGNQLDSDVNVDKKPVPDGVGDACDNCVGVHNTDQANVDGDEFGDACDPYPNDYDNDPEENTLEETGEVVGSEIQLPGAQTEVKCCLEIEIPVDCNSTDPLFIFPPDDCNTTIDLIPIIDGVEGEPMRPYDRSRGYGFGEKGVDPGGDQVKLMPTDHDNDDDCEYYYYDPECITILLSKRFDDDELFPANRGGKITYRAECSYEWSQQDFEIDPSSGECTGEKCFETVIAQVSNSVGQLTFLNRVPVDINIVPDSIEMGSKSKTPIIIYGNPEVKGDDIDCKSVRVGDAEIVREGIGKRTRYMVSVGHYNGDKIPDLKFEVKTQDLELTEGEEYVVVEGQTYGGTPFAGQDTVRVVPHYREKRR